MHELQVGARDPVPGVDVQGLRPQFHRALPFARPVGDVSELQEYVVSQVGALLDRASVQLGRLIVNAAPKERIPARHPCHGDPGSNSVAAISADSSATAVGSRSRETSRSARSSP